MALPPNSLSEQHAVCNLAFKYPNMYGLTVEISSITITDILSRSYFFLNSCSFSCFQSLTRCWLFLLKSVGMSMRASRLVPSMLTAATPYKAILSCSPTPIIFDTSSNTSTKNDLPTPGPPVTKSTGAL